MDPAGKKAPKDNPLGVKGEWLCHGDVLWRPPSKGLVLGKRVEIGSSGACLGPKWAPRDAHMNS